MDRELLRGLPAGVFHELCNGFDLWSGGDHMGAKAKLEGTLTPAASASTPVALLSVHQLLGNIAYEMGDLPKAYLHHYYVLRESRQLNLTLGVASATHSLGLIAEREGDLEEARRQIGEALRLYLQIGCAGGAEAARKNLDRLG